VVEPGEFVVTVEVVDDKFVCVVEPVGSVVGVAIVDGTFV
jgi:hypothetical protein